MKWIYDSYRIDENQKPLPFGYSYGGYITEESFDAMDPARRQEALMQGAVLQDEDAVVAAGTMDEISPIFDSRELAFKVEPSDGIDEVGDVYVADKTSTANGSAIIHIDVDIPPACEAYVLVEGIEAHESTRLDQYLDDNANNAPRSVWDDLSTLEKSRIVLADRDRRSGIEKGLALPIKVSCADKTDTISYRPEGNPWGTGQTVFMANVGYSESARSGIDITFKEAGDYHFDGIKVIAQPMEHYGKWVDGLSEYTLQDVEFGVNEISGSIETDEARLLLLSMPYSTGWSATIDGEPAKLMRANGMFSGLLIEPGVHQIELHYGTPGLKYGLAATAAGLIILIVIAFLMRGKRKRARKADDDTLTGGKDGFIDLAKHRDTNEA
ncbi:MAG: YfhO family protein [Coriobacteriales bacterium]|nr:YfhO family protein [Coriobacteriales bacterium]